MSRHVVLLRRDPSLGLALRALLHGTGRVTELINIQAWSALQTDTVDAVVIDLPPPRRKQAVDLIRSRFKGRLVLVLDPIDDPGGVPSHHDCSVVQRPFEIVELWHLVTTDPEVPAAPVPAEAAPVPSEEELGAASAGRVVPTGGGGAARRIGGGGAAGRRGGPPGRRGSVRNRGGRATRFERRCWVQARGRVHDSGRQPPTGVAARGGARPGKPFRGRCLDLEMARPPLRPGDRDPARPARRRAGTRRPRDRRRQARTTAR